MSDVALARHALLSDCASAALVTAAGSVDWLCLPRFDSAPVFGRLLDRDAGHFSVAPAEPVFSPRWRYRSPGLVLETTWSAPSGELVVIDALALDGRQRGHELGRSAPGVLLRRVRCTRGRVPVLIEYVPRPEFGLVHPRLSVQRGAIVSHGGATVLSLSTDADMTMAAGSASGLLTLAEGQERCFALAQHDPWGPAPTRWSALAVRRRLRATEAAWRSWSALHQRYQGPLRELVLHSGVVLQGLTYQRSGAIVAAPTTSLPEGVHSGRTWDYRYTWLRDASMTMQGLFIAACPVEAGRFFAFVARAAATQLDRGVDLQIMFGIGGERELAEREIGHLEGWRGSGPVRVGNQAWGQRQLDVYGALLAAADTVHQQLGAMDETTRRFLVATVDAAADRWRDDDQGIWEVRGPPRPYLHSKLMCWVALDRGINMARQLGAEDRLNHWWTVRSDIRDAIVERGWSERAGAFTQYFGSDALDASVLLMATVGFLPPDDAGLLATIDAIETGLSDDQGLLYRYRGGDGITTGEGSFLLCTFWLAQALAYTGQLQRSYEVLTRAAGFASPLGLFSEQVDSATGELLGNFPQAFSHLGLITAAQALADAARDESGPSPEEPGRWPRWDRPPCGRLSVSRRRGRRTRFNQ
ncbi:glycoside hydrolase family 15 protein [Mycobacterium sp.]|uniref:glycoside hydrolase family 15 protein n=1 Tax=Mycobacterium sp. TaxID=1785 RepID=UPI002BCDA335|nr:glycoside hydrolase family 15 protein [Mycobacterium sp.]HME49284.1 glycoside hydrolase family 15 protein [Mycobacterium sp.]